MNDRWLFLKLSTMYEWIGDNNLAKRWLLLAIDIFPNYSEPYEWLQQFNSRHR